MITPEDLLATSQEIYKKDNKTEVDLRNVTRLAYYAIYHKLKKLSEDINIDDSVISNCGTHEKLIKTLESSNDHKIYAELLRTNRANRVTADYKLSRNHTTGESYKTLRSAEKLFQKLQA
ncbi:TPA: hypothetical protein ACX6Q4_002545 [Photobacterium damselae]|uniref:hypothetical protein n=1 Tax=Photobacterium damselae TaxID=38293 RepID=UPI0030F4107A